MFVCKNTFVSFPHFYTSQSLPQRLSSSVVTLNLAFKCFSCHKNKETSFTNFSTIQSSFSFFHRMSFHFSSYVVGIISSISPFINIGATHFKIIRRVPSFSSLPSNDDNVLVYYEDVCQRCFRDLHYYVQKQSCFHWFC